MISVFIYACLALPAEANPGASECPCISNTSDKFAALQSALLAAGLSKSYGATGCKAYDANSDQFGCASNEQAFCLDAWCYVDPDLCPVDRDACHAAGGKVGSKTSAYCRSRKSVASSLLSSDAAIFAYSYETCGVQEQYGQISVEFPAAGELVIAVHAWPPWVVSLKSPSGEDQFGGAAYEFWFEALKLFSPQATSQIIPGWSTPTSRAKHPENSYTACVHDVAVGNFDACVADVWITPQRLTMSPFSIAIRQDLFYLIIPTPTEMNEPTLYERLQRPFAPFTDSAWFLVSAFLLSAMVIVTLVRLWDVYDGHFEAGFKRLCKYACKESCLTFFDIHHTFLSGGTHEGGPVSLANSVIRTALAFFGLVILASYTASLASLLVVEQQARSPVKDLGDATDRGIKVCAASALLSSFKAAHPRTAAANLFVSVIDHEDAPRKMYAEVCGAAIVSEGVIDKLYAGMLKERDCKFLENGDLTREEAHCHKGFSGKARDDCKFSRVGDIVFSQPCGYPLNPNIQQPMSWALAALQASGVWEATLSSNAHNFPTSRCNYEDTDSEKKGLSVDDLSGTMIISFAILALGLVLFICQVCVVRHTRHKHGDLLTWFDDDSDHGEQDADGEEVQLAHGEQDIILQLSDKVDQILQRMCRNDTSAAPSADEQDIQDTSQTVNVRQVRVVKDENQVVDQISGAKKGSIEGGTSFESGEACLNCKEPAVLNADADESSGVKTETVEVLKKQLAKAKQQGSKVVSANTAAGVRESTRPKNFDLDKTMKTIIMR